MRYIQHVVLFLAIVLSVFLALSETDYGSTLENTTRYASEKQNAFRPDSILFCGEVIPMTEPDVKEKFERELAIYTKYKSSTRLLISRANKWFPQFDPILSQKGVPADLKYLVAVESAFTNVRSNRGAVGFWQIRAITGRSLGLEINEEIDDRLNPTKATWAAAKYFKMAYKIFGEWTMAAASYNMGISGLKRRINQQKPETYYDLELNQETARYLYKALAFKEVFENPEQYDIYPKVSSMPKLPGHKVTEPIASLEAFAKKINSHPDSIRKYNPWILGNRIPIKKGEAITIYAPLVKELGFNQKSNKLTPLNDDISESVLTE